MNIVTILQRRYPTALWTLHGDDYDGLLWESDDPKPTEQELLILWDEVQLEAAWDRVRAERDRLLAASDWTQVADAPVDSAAWAVYRQALRDVPQDYASPDEVVWPTPPA